MATLEQCQAAYDAQEPPEYWLDDWQEDQEEVINEMPGIRFRCLFCGKEYDTVEECNVCEESH